ncbi:MAG TPA: phosphonate metabolism transcriptional regulator PhnF [Xanthobacteraceae bacterium]|nr:phosphonate metabolism transcriptional regulator PhnF [Xanthobacteraceae bacterium]
MLTRTPRVRQTKSHFLERGVTLWRCIADDYEQLILAGKRANGERLPPEVEIAAQYGVNRHTVRRAMAELSARGLVRTERGSGTFVQIDKLNYGIGRFTRFSEIMAASGLEAEGRLQGSRLEPASEELARNIGVAPGEMALRLEIVRIASRIPVSVATTWLSAEKFPDVARIFRRVRSLTQALEACGVVSYQRKWTRIGAAFADAVDAARLRISVHRPVLVVEGGDILPDGTPLMFTRGRFAADRVALTVET